MREQVDPQLRNGGEPGAISKNQQRILEKWTKLPSKQPKRENVQRGKGKPGRAIWTKGYARLATVVQGEENLEFGRAARLTSKEGNRRHRMGEEALGDVWSSCTTMLKSRA